MRAEVKLRGSITKAEPPPAAVSESRKSPARRFTANWPRRLLIAAAIIGTLWIARASLLRGAAQAWIIDEPAAKVDAVVVLGGGLDSRPFKAAEYYQAGLASKILIAKTETSPVQQLGLQPADCDQVTAILTNAGVPPQAIIRFGDGVTSTHDEAVALRECARTNQIQSVLIPTDPFHTRRVKWLFEKTLAGTGVKISTAVINNKRYSSTNWWTKEEGLVTFQNEVLKYGYYRWHY